ncbi:hypothetical protein AAG906_017070 [Vitis piasezkii]
MLMENFLRSKEYWQVVSRGIAEPATNSPMTDTQKTEIEGQRLKDLKVKNYLFQAIDRSILETIRPRGKLQALRSEFETLNEAGSRFDYFSRTMAIINKMRIHGEKMDDVIVIDKILPDRGRGKGRGVQGVRDGGRGRYGQDNFRSMNNLSVSVVCGHSCSNHMCGSKSSFCFLNEGFRSTVSFGDCSTVNVMGKGDINIRTKNGFVETISNVFYVPDLKSNLLSVGQLQEKGYIITIQKGACEIYDHSRGAIAIVQMASNRLFPLKIDSVHLS